MADDKNMYEPLVQDIPCEKMVLGLILKNGSIYDHVSGVLDDECFRSEKNILIWRAMGEVRKRGELLDSITVTAELAKEGAKIVAYDIFDLLENSDAPLVTIDTYVYRLKELSLRRRLWRLGQRLVTAGVAETEDIIDIQQMATEELNGLFEKVEGTFTLTDALTKLLDIINQNMSKGHITGTPTGFRKMDEKGGLQGSDLIIIAGETSQGKSSYALSIVKNVIENNHKVAFFSMEMTKEQLAARLVSMKCGVKANTIMYDGELDEHQLEAIDKATGALPGDNLYFDERSTSSLDTILLSIRTLKLKYDIDGAVVDYLQILNVNSKNSNYSREQAMGDAARRLKNLAKELNIWIIALSQLSRNQQDPEPSLARLRDSGQIAEAADVVMLVYRPEYYHRTFPHPFETLTDDEVKGKAMIDVAKGRNIGVFKFLVQFNAGTTHFTDITEEPIPVLGPVEEDAPF